MRFPGGRQLLSGCQIDGRVIKAAEISSRWVSRWNNLFKFFNRHVKSTRLSHHQHSTAVTEHRYYAHGQYYRIYWRNSFNHLLLSSPITSIAVVVVKEGEVIMWHGLLGKCISRWGETWRRNGKGHEIQFHIPFMSVSVLINFIKIPSNIKNVGIQFHPQQTVIRISLFPLCP